MYKINTANQFKKQFRKYSRKNIKIKKRIFKAIRLLAENPLHPSLKSHQVNSRRFGIKWSSRVSGDLRIIWDYSQTEINVLDILDLGSHSGGDKVYK